MNWREWLIDDRLLGIDGVESDFLLFLLAVSGSLLTSILISFLYYRFFGSRSTGNQFHRAFLLIGPSITVIFIAVQFSLPLSLGLLGALSVVRFRMPIKEAEEIGFILLLIAVSLGWATFNVGLLGTALLVAVVALLLIAVWPWLRWRGGDGTVVITLPSAEYSSKSAELLDALESSFPRGRIDSISENDRDSTISYSFSRLDKAALLELRERLAKITNLASSNFFFNEIRG